MIVKFKQWNCSITKYKYTNGRTALRLYDVDDHLDPVATATINIPKEKINDNEVIIKDYAENEGMYDALIKSGVISSAKRYVITGYVECPVCELLI